MTDPLLGPSVPLVPPLYQSSVYTLPDLDALDRVMNGEEPGFIYARDGHPNAESARGQARRAGRRPSGRSSAAPAWPPCPPSFLGYVEQRRPRRRQQPPLRPHHQAARARSWTGSASRRRSLTATTCDAGPGRVRPARTRLLFVETMSNPLLRTVDVPALAEIARQHEAKLVVDNTFATPVLYAAAGARGRPGDGEPDEDDRRALAT